MKKKSRNLIGCEECTHLIPIGEGDHVCYQCGEPVIVTSDYAPTNDYLKCAGEHYAT